MTCGKTGAAAHRVVGGGKGGIGLNFKGADGGVEVIEGSGSTMHRRSAC